MKGKTYGLVFLLLAFLILLGAREERKNRNDSYVRISDCIISGEKELRIYCEEQGREYDSALLEVRRVTEEFQISSVRSRSLLEEFYIDNVIEKEEVNNQLPIRVQGMPQGKCVIDEEINITSYCEKNSRYSLSHLEDCLGIKLQEKSWNITWKGMYDIPVIIRIFPIYKVISGTMWEDDVWKDDDMGSFIMRVPVGYELRVYDGSGYIDNNTQSNDEAKNDVAFFEENKDIVVFLPLSISGNKIV